MKMYSQNNEDEIIQSIIDKYDIKNKVFFEFGIQDGKECNSRNLVENYGWNGIMIEANKKDFIKAKKFYEDYPVKIINAFVTPENINDFVSDETEILSIDIDDNDYSVWNALNKRPKIVIIEYNSLYKGIVISNGNALRNKGKPFPYCLASIFNPEYYTKWGSSENALIELGREKGYTPIKKNNTNLFFIRNDLK